MSEEQGRVINPFESERAAPALAAIESDRAVAEVKASLWQAKNYPRDPVKCMDLILQDCTRMTLAEQATYSYVRGGNEITGPSIRMAEAIVRRWGNMSCSVDELSRTNGMSECMALAVDLETNNKKRMLFHIRHWRDTKKGGYVLKDERDIYELIANFGARRLRACILAVIPPEVTEAALKQCEVTLATHFEVTPELLSKMIDAFAKYGVAKAQIEKRIQRRLDAITPALMAQLHRILTSLREDMASPADFFDTEDAELKAKLDAAGADLKERLKAKAKREDPLPPIDLDNPAPQQQSGDLQE